jgi:glycosyltransferase involved in cell wall biosynthesis
VTVSRLDPDHRYKGHHAIVRSFGAVLASRPDARWIVVGAGADLPTIRRACIERGIAHAVEFTGEVTDAQLATIYSSARALVLPSVADPEATPPIGEGFGLVYAEAGAFGVSSIASTASGGAADYVEDGVTGLTVAPNDEAALSSAMLRLAEEPELASRLGSAARSRTRQHHLPERFGGELEQALAWRQLRQLV